jgi:hypothetical protein
VKHLGDVLGNRVTAHMQSVGNLDIGEPGRDQAQNRELAVGVSNCAIAIEHRWVMSGG